MMKTPLIFFLLIIQSLSSQFLVEGVVTDAETGQTLPYVNIGIPAQGIGTVSDESGFYTLYIPADKMAYQIRFSMVGYAAHQVLISSLQEADVRLYDVALSPQTTLLNEVVVTDGSWEVSRVGNKTKSKRFVSGFTSNKLGNEMAQFVQVKKNCPTKVQSFWVSIAENTLESVILRLNLYSVHEGFPHENMLTTPILIEVPNTPQVVSVDLTPYEIYVEDSFFISLEWIEDIGIEGLWFSAGMLGKSLFARATSQDRWVQQKFNIGMGVEILQQKN